MHAITKWLCYYICGPALIIQHQFLDNLLYSTCYFRFSFLAHREGLFFDSKQLLFQHIVTLPFYIIRPYILVNLNWHTD